MNYLEDVPTAGEFGFNTDSWMKSDTTQKDEVLIKHLLTNFFDFLYRTVTDRNEDDANNYMYTSSTEVISMGLFQFYYTTIFPISSVRGYVLYACFLNTHGVLGRNIVNW